MSCQQTIQSACRQIILMISLKDEIKRFENMVYNKQLAQFVTVDQNFVGGGIRIQSMIQQSNFIVEELKKMNAAFLNYCKLNEKVYNKIIEHQLNLHDEQARLNSLTTTFDRKIDEMTKNMKELYESTVQQSQKSFIAIDALSLSLRQELNNKVDKHTFEAQMKKILEEYDQGVLDKDQNIEEVNDVRIENDCDGLGGLTADGLPIVRKKGKVGYEDFYRLQAEIHNKMKASNLKLDETSSETVQVKGLILKYIPVINKNSSEISLHTTQVYKINQEMVEQQKSFTSITSKITQELSSKTSDQYWSIKLSDYFQKQLRPIFDSNEQNIKEGQKQLKKYKQEAHFKFTSIDNEFLQHKNTINSIDKVIKQHSIDIEGNSQSIRSNYETFCQDKIKIQKSINHLKQDFTKKIENYQSIAKCETQKLQNAIENLVATIEESVLKAVNKKVQFQLKTIQSQIRMNKDKIKGQRNDIGAMLEEIKNVRDILSKKANFSDIIQQFERKADREDFRQLETKMQQTSQQFVSKNLNQSINLSRVDKPERVRANSTSRASKTLVPPRSATNRLNKTDLEVGTKIFMCGLDGPLGQNRGIRTQNSRRKSLKSSAAVINDFIL